MVREHDHYQNRYAGNQLTPFGLHNEPPFAEKDPAKIQTIPKSRNPVGTSWQNTCRFIGSEAAIPSGLLLKKG